MNSERIKFAQRFAEVAASLGFEGHGRQTRLAEQYGKKQPSVKKWFDGEAQPDYEVCVDMCRRAKVYYEWLMTGRGPKQIDEGAQKAAVPARVELIYADPEEIKILTAYREATQEGKEAIRTSAEIAPRADKLTLGPRID